MHEEDGAGGSDVYGQSVNSRRLQQLGVGNSFYYMDRDMRPTVTSSDKCTGNSTHSPQRHLRTT